MASRVLWGGLIALLLFVVVALHGCCDDPEPHLKDWKPDYGEFKRKADWVDDQGIWRGNPTWKFAEELEVEDHHCKTWNGTVCVVWTIHEWNCNEHDFGMCKCTDLADDGDYCSEWGCHALEADQEVCRRKAKKQTEDAEVCQYAHFPMDENRYLNLVQRQAQGYLTTGEPWWSWRWGYNGRPTHGWSWPPYHAYAVQSRHDWYAQDGVCIVNGDNKALARRRCGRWREIETEISYCKCRYGRGKACLDWTCEERDVGLFSVLWRTDKDITAYAEGSEMEEYKCLDVDIDGRCMAYEGQIDSKEEVEWTRCERRGNGSWYCDEYEYPKTLEWHHPQYGNKFMIFLFLEAGVSCMFCKTFGKSEDALIGSLLCNCYVGVILFPFLMVTFGFYAFLAISLPFWILRCLCCTRFIVRDMKLDSDVLCCPCKCCTGFLSSKDSETGALKSLNASSVEENPQVCSNEPTNITSPAQADVIGQATPGNGSLDQAVVMRRASVQSAGTSNFAPIQIETETANGMDKE